MYFKSIYMHGFKSFPEPVTIEFHRGITCIVGPNGSGKSNISDAVRWVLGEQSPKMLRGGKMEEVIFSGTASRKSRGMAEVTLTIDNSDRALDIDYNEVAITRRMFRSGESEYYLNSNQCRLRDIRELIMDTGIGVDGYSLIGQGKISDIISNRTESRREMFEEAAGIVMYRTKKESSEKKLASAKDNLDRINDIVGEIEGRIDGLREESIKAKEFVGIRDRLKVLEINITLKNIDGIEEKVSALENEKAETEKELSEKNRLISESDESISVKRGETERLENEKNEKRNSLLALVEEINGLMNRKYVEEEKLSYIEKNSERLKEELEKAEEKHETEMRNVESFREQKKEIDRIVEGMRDKHSVLVTVQEKAVILLDEVSVSEDEEKRRAEQLRATITSVDVKRENLERNIENIEARYNGIRDEKNSGENGIRDALDDLNRLKNEKKGLSMRLSGLDDEIKALKEINSQNAEDEARKSAEKKNNEIEISRLMTRMKTIEEMENNYEGYKSAVRYIMKSGLKGVDNVVAGLIEVPEGNEIAIETALGQALQNIVCSDDTAAREAIRLLKENRAGRLTFLPKNMIKANPLRDGRLESAQGFVGYGTDCVTFDPGYREIMEYLLGRSAVFDNIENAANAFRKSSKRIKLVTLDGEIITPAGALTGGKYRNRTANLLERKAEINSLKKRIKETGKKNDILTVETEELKRKIEEGKEKERLSSEEYHNTELKLVEKRNKIAAAELILSDLREGKDRFEKQLDEALAEKAGSEERIRLLNDEKEELLKELSACEENIASIHSEHEDLKTRVEKASEKITEARISLTAAESEKAGVDSLAERVSESLSSLEREIEEKKKEYDSLEKERAEILSQHVDVDRMVTEKKEKKSSIEKRIEGLTDEHGRLMDEISELERIRNEAEKSADLLKDRKTEAEIREARLETKLENLKNRLWDDFEVSYIAAAEFRADDFVMSSALKESREYKARIKELGDVNVGSIKEYETVSARYEFLTGQRNDITESMKSLQDIIDETDRIIRKRFRESFNMIVRNFEEIFVSLFGGGYARLLLEDENEPLTSPIEIIAQPPGKALKNINLLSGGEKTMTAIALMFAVLKTKPTSFCILDEVEAALDDANIERFAKYLRDSFNDIQFTLVTHKRATMEYADVLYGVTMPEQGISKILSLELDGKFPGTEG